MDKYEYNIKAEQITKLINKRDFSTAAKIADNIDWRRVRNVNMLANVGTVYAEVRRYEDAKELFLMAFERAPISRRLAYKLADVCIRAGQLEEAEQYYEDFVGLAPKDSGRYELQYQLAKRRGEPIGSLIAILQEYKKNDFDEAWSYELARLYHKAGMGQECVQACDEIILWFGEGEYVEKAMELKMLYAPLSPSQQEKYNKRYQPQMRYVPQEEPKQLPMEMIQQPEAAEADGQPQEQIPEQPVSVSTDLYNTANIQQALAESMKEILQNEEEEPHQEAERAEDAEDVPNMPEKTDFFGTTRDLRDSRNTPVWNNIPYRPAEPEEPEETSGEEVPFRIVSSEQAEEQQDGAELPLQEAEESEYAEAAAIPEQREKVYPFVKPEIQREEKETPVAKAMEHGKLTEELQHAFAAFLHINGLEEQLADIFEEAEKSGGRRETSETGNILIIGDHKSGKTTLATELIKNLSKVACRKNRKIAKISGDRLNSKGIHETIARLAGADLLVERAGEMNQVTVEALIEAMGGRTGGMLVVLEDTKEGMARLIAENPAIEERFGHKLILKEYEISEWVEMAKQYAQELDYGIDEMATLALSAKIDALYAQKTVVDMDDVKGVIDAAIEHSEKKNIKKLFETVFSRKYKDSDLTMLRENDFV